MGGQRAAGGVSYKKHAIRDPSDESQQRHSKKISIYSLKTRSKNQAACSQNCVLSSCGSQSGTGSATVNECRPSSNHRAAQEVSYFPIFGEGNCSVGLHNVCVKKSVAQSLFLTQTPHKKSTSSSNNDGQTFTFDTCFELIIDLLHVFALDC